MTNIVRYNNTNTEASRINCDITVSIWDVSGQEKEKSSLDSSIYRQACGFFICCSYDIAESLNNTREWIKFIIEKLGNQNSTNLSKIPLFILCNKFDIENKLKKFGNNEIQLLLEEINKENNLFQIKLYHEVSAKKDINVNHAFKQIIKVIFEVSDKENLYIKNQTGNLSSLSPIKKNKLPTSSLEIKPETNRNKTFIIDKSLNKKIKYDKCCK